MENDKFDRETIDKYLVIAKKQYPDIDIHWEELLFSRNFSKRMFFSKYFWKNVIWRSYFSKKSLFRFGEAPRKS